MFYVYYLVSLINNDVYIGSTNNIQKRLKQHNAGRVKSTKAYKPWKLLGYEKFQTRSEAFKKELFYKNHQQKDIIKKKFNLK